MSTDGYRLDNVRALCSEPDGDGDRKFSARAEVSFLNDGGEGHVRIRLILKNDQGLPLLQKENAHKVTPLAGESAPVFVRNYRPIADITGLSASVDISLFQRATQPIEDRALEAFEDLMGSGTPREIVSGVTLLGWAMRTEAPDDDNDRTVHFILHFENTSGRAVEAQTMGHIFNKKNKAIVEFEESITLDNGTRGVVSTNTFTHKKKLRKARRVEVLVHIDQLLGVESFDLPLQFDHHQELLKACQAGDMKALNGFVAGGADATRVGDDGTYPIHWAAQGGHLDMVQRLHELGADIEARDVKGRTTLSRAALMGHGDVVAWLLDRGADVNAETPRENNALDLAARNGHAAMVQQLHHAGSHISPVSVMRAASAGHVDVVRYFCEEAPDQDLLENRGQSMATSAMEGQEAVIAYLVETGDLKNSAEFAVGLSMAANAGHLGIVQRLYPLVEPPHQDLARNFADDGGHTEMVEWMDEQRSD